jgi:hypothetical protein
VEPSEALVGLFSSHRCSVDAVEQVEGTVWGTTSGCNVKFHNFYGYWEYRVYQTLISLISKNLQCFNKACRDTTPLFTIHTMLAAPDVIAVPTGNEVS